MGLNNEEVTLRGAEVWWDFSRLLTSLHARFCDKKKSRLKGLPVMSNGRETMHESTEQDF